MTQIATTYFASPEYADAQTIQEQHAAISKLPFVSKLVESIPEIVMVLNDQRQIIYANQSLAELLNLNDLGCIFGKRPGEVLQCQHAQDAPSGCGTAEACQTCGAVRAILCAQQGNGASEECRISDVHGHSLDLKVTAHPFETYEQSFTFIVIADISHEKRRRALERIFFHDLLNTAGSLRGLSEVFKECDPNELQEFRTIVHDVSDKIVEEILAQRELTAAESGDLVIQASPVLSLEVLQDIANLYRSHEVADGREIQLDPNSQNVSFTTDPRLLRRVIGNMTKNALEASSRGQTVTLGVQKIGSYLIFRVHNPNHIPKDIQLQIFQRSFSTKGADRGLGTYSIKLLSERYLRGLVSFTSVEEEGTTFMARFPIEWR